MNFYSMYFSIFLAPCQSSVRRSTKCRYPIIRLFPYLGTLESLPSITCHVRNDDCRLGLQYRLPNAQQIELEWSAMPYRVSRGLVNRSTWQATSNGDVLMERYR
jgi:hypothetical protein